MKMSDAFPSKYVAAHDLEGRPRKMTMANIVMEEVGRERDTKPVLYFVGATKGMILNKTNGNCIAAQYGEDMDLWPGKDITI